MSLSFALLFLLFAAAFFPSNPVFAAREYFVDSLAFSSSTRYPFPVDTCLNTSPEIASAVETWVYYECTADDEVTKYEWTKDSFTPAPSPIPADMQTNCMAYSANVTPVTKSKLSAQTSAAANACADLDWFHCDSMNGFTSSVTADVFVNECASSEPIMKIGVATGVCTCDSTESFKLSCTASVADEITYSDTSCATHVATIPYALPSPGCPLIMTYDTGIIGLVGILAQLETCVTAPPTPSPTATPSANTPSPTTGSPTTGAPTQVPSTAAPTTANPTNINGGVGLLDDGGAAHLSTCAKKLILLLIIVMGIIAVST